MLKPVELADLLRRVNRILPVALCEKIATARPRFGGGYVHTDATPPGWRMCRWWQRKEAALLAGKLLVAFASTGAVLRLLGETNTHTHTDSNTHQKNIHFARTTRKGEAYEVIIDAANVHLYRQHPWQRHTKGLIRYTGKKKGQGSVLLHRAILNLPPDLYAVFRNGNPFDVRRANMEVITYAQQRQRQKKKPTCVGHCLCCLSANRITLLLLPPGLSDSPFQGRGYRSR